MLFSIIIPIYNAEENLDRCLSGVLNQSVSDFQIIAVDDGSTDNSLAAAKRYARQDGRISVISIPHSGAGAARNAGLAAAQGAYVLFLDADDYWSGTGLLQNLKAQIDHAAPDVLMFQMRKVMEDGTVLKRFEKPAFSNENVLLQLSDVYQDLVRDGQSLASACNKCVKRSLLEEKAVRFREDVLCEDIDWVLQLFSEAKTIVLLNLYAYAYTQHKYATRSTDKNAPEDLADIVNDWGSRLIQKTLAHSEAVAGLTAFEYGICMGNHHLLSGDKKALMRKNVHLLQYGLDRKTKLIYRFYRVFGYHLTCAAIRLYLLLRRIW